MQKLNDFIKKDIRALSRFISLAENLNPEIYEILNKVYPKKYSGSVVGITGSPGVGKSTLCNNLIHCIREGEKTVAMVAVDPMSPFTGGALLGDRIRMTGHFNDTGVYIRSLSTRGKLGGLSISFRQTLHLLEAFGFDSILVETVGVGQSEVDIHKMADIVCVVLSPDGGDSIQTLKSGIMEIADVFIINKSDREGADKLKNELKVSLDIFNKKNVPILLTNQNKPESYKELHQALVDLAEKNKAAILKKRNEQVSHTIEEITEWAIKQQIAKKFSKIKNAKNPYENILKIIKKISKIK